MREIFLVQDSRPLYTYPEVDLFAPAKVKPSQDVVAADGDTATAATSYDEEDEEEGNEENQEEGDAGECQYIDWQLLLFRRKLYYCQLVVTWIDFLILRAQFLLNIYTV